MVIGDFGSGSEDMDDIAGAVRDEDERAALDAVVTTGDNIYPDGTASYFEEAWLEPYGWVQDESIPVLASLGNHDVEVDADAVMELLDMPARWYVETVGPVEFVVLDSTVVADPGQRSFLERVLDAPKETGVPFRVVVMHHSPHSCSLHQSNQEILRTWVPSFEHGAVDLVLSGHDHVYERFGPIDGITFVVTGGGGYELHDVGDCPSGTPAPESAAEEFHYVLIEATREELRLQAISSGGELVDTFTLDRRTSSHNSTL